MLDRTIFYAKAQWLVHSIGIHAAAGHVHNLCSYAAGVAYRRKRKATPMGTALAAHVWPLSPLAPVAKKVTKA